MLIRTLMSSEFYELMFGYDAKQRGVPEKPNFHG